MPSSEAAAGAEHFVTLFDNNFLPIGLCLHASLLEHAQPFHLWILCMDQQVEQNLRHLSLSHVSLIPLREAEDGRLLAIKSTRSRGEYCWTLTPFTPQFVFERDATAEQVTYLDADLFFFDAPERLLEEFRGAGKHVQITEHAYDPRYERFGRASRSGRFCVQFMTFRRTPQAEKVMRWWQERCLEWCYARVEDGKFGDQKYLDVWPDLFRDEVHILEQKEKTLAPWNVAYYNRLGKGSAAPVFYHFHGLRILSHNELLLYSGYRIGRVADCLYQSYLHALGHSVAVMKQAGMAIPCMPRRSDWLGRLATLKRQWIDGEKTITYRI